MLDPDNVAFGGWHFIYLGISPEKQNFPTLVAHSHFSQNTAIMKQNYDGNPADYNALVEQGYSFQLSQYIKRAGSFSFLPLAHLLDSLCCTLLLKY